MYYKVKKYQIKTKRVIKEEASCPAPVSRGCFLEKVYAPNLHIAESLPSKSVQSPVQEVLVQQG
jgi:hypothetical protein